MDEIELVKYSKPKNTQGMVYFPTFTTKKLPNTQLFVSDFVSPVFQKPPRLC